MSRPAGVYCRVLGPVQVTVAGADAPPELLWRKHVALLVYLARSPRRRRTREHLVGLLWSDRDEKQARHSLSRSEEHTSELQSQSNLVCRLLLEKKKHVYTTSHAAPATLGDLLAVTCLLLFLRLRSDRRAIIPLLLVSGRLVVTHHLSLYFLLVLVVGAIVVRGLARPWQGGAGTRREIAFAFVLAVGTFAFWFGYATPFRDTILPSVNIQPWWALILAFPIGVAILAGIIFARRR